MTAGLVALLIVALTPMPASAQGRVDVRRGADLYAEKCVLCHGAKGEGWDWGKKVETPPVPVPDLAVAGPQRSDAFLFDVIKDGGEAVGRTRFMPPFGFQLDDDEIRSLVAFVRSLKPGTAR